MGKKIRRVGKTVQFRDMPPNMYPQYKAEYDALNTVRRLEKQGWNFREIVVDAINYAEGRTPEMYSGRQVSLGGVDPDAMRGVIRDELQEFNERLLSELAQEVASEIAKVVRAKGVQALDEISSAADDGGDAELSPFAKKMARSFARRKAQK